MRRTPFTLIELLTVILVIAVLASLLYPSFLSAPRQAQLAVCTSNFQQMGNGVDLFGHDNKNGMPWGHPNLPSGTKPLFGIIAMWTTNRQST